MNPTRIEARRLWSLGFAIHWLRPKSKIPVEGGWTTGPRKRWEDLEKSYRKDYNTGVRLGTPSRFEDGFLHSYLAVIDVDIKSTDERHRKEAFRAAQGLLDGHMTPIVSSGRGNGSRHYYCRTRAPFKTFTPFRSDEEVKLHAPSKKPSRRETEVLTREEITAGVRLGPAWEVSLYSDGRQVVLPPSIHPDTGEEYRWKLPLQEIADLPVLEFERPVETALPEKPAATVTPLEDFEVERVELSWLPISLRVRDAIVHGTDVTDRSGFLLRASSALFSAGLTQNEVLTVLTDPTTFLGACAFEHAKTRSRKRAAEWVYRFTTARVEKERSASVFENVALVVPKKLSPEEQAAQAKEFEEERHWTQDIVKNQYGTPQKLINNVILIVTNAVAPLVVRRDLFAFRDAYSCDTPWGGKKGSVICDDDVDELQSWLGKHHGFEPPKHIVESALVVISRRNAFDPVKERLDVLPEWDKRPRLDTWLARHFEAKGEKEYLAQVFRKWITAMVMRIYHPGAKFDWMPIFEGAQGVGKSSFGRLLVGDKYFLDWLPNLQDKESLLSLQGMWGVEMGELSQFRRNQLETIKAFVTRTVDKFRPPFGKRLIESPRRCVFFGTTNHKTYLIDETGNRRFKPVEVGNLDFEALERDRVQLFAEAKCFLKCRPETVSTLELTGRASAFEKTLHAEKMVEDDSHSMEESMRDFLEKVKTEEIRFDFERFKIMDLFEGRGPLGNWKKENRNLQFAAKMLKRLGGESRFIHGRKVWKIENSVEGGGFL